MASCEGPSNACTLEQALASVSATKNVIKLDAGTYTPAASNFAVDANVTIDARGATLHSKVDGTLLDIRAGRTVSLLGGTLATRAPRRPIWAPIGTEGRDRRP